MKASIRTNMLGKDADRNEYWHFKEDPERVYIQKEEAQEHEDPYAVAEAKIYWQYIDEEEKFDQLIESMNPKGIRERKLLEGLRRCRDRLKLKKAKKVAAIVAVQQDVPMALEEVVEENKDEGSGSAANVDMV